MKTKNNLLRISLSSGFAFALACAAWLPTTAHAQDTKKPMKPMKGGEHQMMAGKMTDSCKDMMQQKKKMMEEMKAQDTALTEQVAQMNRAPENQKSALMAAIVTKMVEQRTAGNAKMEKMHAQMMGHMMEHMQMGKESMAQCPMMKGMKGMDEKSGDAHKEHQQEQK